MTRLFAVAETPRARALDNLAQEMPGNVAFWRPGKFIVFRHLPCPPPVLRVTHVDFRDALAFEEPLPRKLPEILSFTYIRISRYRWAIFADEEVGERAGQRAHDRWHRIHLRRLSDPHPGWRPCENRTHPRARHEYAVSCGPLGSPQHGPLIP